MSRIIIVACVALFGASSTWAAPEAAAMPTFRDIEYRYTDTEALDAGREAISQAIPVGMPIALAQQILGKAGARCKPMKHDLQTIRCSYFDVGMDDDVVADFQWKVLLHTLDNKVSGVSVDRVINRKGPPS